MNKSVKYPLAKLLKKKGFNIPTVNYYHITGSGPFETAKRNWNNDEENETAGGMTYVSAPTIADVVMWIYEKYGIWIWVDIFSKMFRPYVVEEGDTWGFRKWEGHKYNSPTEAYEAAIEYTLNKLI